MDSWIRGLVIRGLGISKNGKVEEKIYLCILMQVKIFKWANVMNHCGRNVVMLNAFNDFFNQLSYCDWTIPSDIIRSFRTADIISCEGKTFNRVVFNIGGNKYRMICGYKFGKNKVMLYVRFVGSHSNYDKIRDVCSVNMFG